CLPGTQVRGTDGQCRTPLWLTPGQPPSERPRLGLTLGREGDVGVRAAVRGKGARGLRLGEPSVGDGLAVPDGGQPLQVATALQRPRTGTTSRGLQPTGLLAVARLDGLPTGRLTGLLAVLCRLGQGRGGGRRRRLR